MSKPQKIHELFPKEVKKKLRKEMDKKPEFQHKLQRYIATELENVSGLKKQMSAEQCERLVDEYSKEAIHQTLLEMENYKPLQKKYMSVYLTLNNWLKLKQDREKASQKGDKKGGWVATYEEALQFMQRNDLTLDHRRYFEPVEQPGDSKPLWRKK